MASYVTHHHIPFAKAVFALKAEPQPHQLSHTHGRRLLGRHVAVKAHKIVQYIVWARMDPLVHNVRLLLSLQHHNRVHHRHHVLHTHGRYHHGQRVASIVVVVSHLLLSNVYPHPLVWLYLTHPVRLPSLPQLNRAPRKLASLVLFIQLGRLARLAVVVVSQHVLPLVNRHRMVLSKL